MPKQKTINLLLYEGDLEGVISIEDSSWNSGELYSAPRDSVSELLETDACKKYGVYLLLSKSMVYVGQSSDLSKRITQHTVGKDWWESVVILTTKDDSLTQFKFSWQGVFIVLPLSAHKRFTAGWGGTAPSWGDPAPGSLNLRRHGLRGVSLIG